MFRVILGYTQDSYSNTLSGILLTYLSYISLHYLFRLILLIGLFFYNRSVTLRSVRKKRVGLATMGVTTQQECDQSDR